MLVAKFLQCQVIADSQKIREERACQLRQLTVSYVQEEGEACFLVDILKVFFPKVRFEMHGEVTNDVIFVVAYEAI